MVTPVSPLPTVMANSGPNSASLRWAWRAPLSPDRLAARLWRRHTSVAAQGVDPSPTLTSSAHNRFACVDVSSGMQRTTRCGVAVREFSRPPRGFAEQQGLLPQCPFAGGSRRPQWDPRGGFEVQSKFYVGGPLVVGARW